MIYELATLEITPGNNEDFEKAVNQAAILFQQAKGYESIELQHCIEQPEVYILKVGWSSVEDHMVTFRESDAFQKWRELVTPYFAKPPAVQHVNVIKNWD
jgi:heme-degrading monooxygenase HmoA